MKPIILMVGLNHTTAPIHVREQIASARCLRNEAHDSLALSLDPSIFSEALILSTCNRTEIYAVALERARAEQALLDSFSAHEAFPAPRSDYLYVHADRGAAAHLFAVASGIDSMMLGEFEILGQIRDAYQNAAKNKTIGPVLHRLFEQAIGVGRRARSETAIGAGATSVAYGAVALARRRLGDLKGRSALVIGAGEMGRRAARNLADDGACTVLVASRTLTHAQDLAAEIGSRAIGFDELRSVLEQVDVVISATKAPHQILSAETVAAAMQARPDRPLCLIDIAVPRDVDPAAAQIPNVCVKNIDDLEELVASNRAARNRAIDDVRPIIEHELADFWHWYMGRRAAPVLAELGQRAESIRQSELDKTLRRLSHLSPEDREAVAALSSGIVKKLLAAPRTTLKERMQGGDGQLYLDMLRELFELEQVE